MQEHVAEVESVVRTLFRIAELCCTDEPVFIFRELYAGDVEIVDDGRLSSGFSVIPRWLDAFFASPVKKDSIDKRVRSAIHLLVESDRQDNPAIGLALSVAAMEALVCFKGSDIANTFAAHTARLLEPQLDYRAGAEKYFKRLYNARSRTLHGEILQQEAAVRRNGLQVAAALLKVIQDWHDTMRRIKGEPVRPCELEALLADEKFVDGPLDGVLDGRILDGFTLSGSWRDEGDPDTTIHVDLS